MKKNRWIRINRRRNVYEEEGQLNKWENKMAQKEKEGWEREDVKLECEEKREGAEREENQERNKKEKEKKQKLEKMCMKRSQIYKK